MATAESNPTDNGHWKAGRHGNGHVRFGEKAPEECRIGKSPTPYSTLRTVLWAAGGEIPAVDPAAQNPNMQKLRPALRECITYALCNAA